LTIRSRTVTAIAVLTLTLGVAGCGTEEQPQSTSAAATTSAPAPKVVHLTTASFLPAMKTAMSDKKSLRSTMQMVAGGKTSTVAAVQSMGKRPAIAVDLNGEAFGGKGRIIVVNNLIYVSMNGLAPAGKYLKVDPKDSGNPLAAQMGTMLDGMDPTKTFDAFESGLKSVKHVGTETVDGSPLEHYEVTLDMARVLRAQKKQLPAGTPKTVAYDIWMDSANLMRKVAFELQGVSMVMKTSGWGQPVNIKAPAAADIVQS
jgi:hypothetical protein